MTDLGGIIMDCTAIRGMDRLILFGWAAQLEEGNDTVYASKENVAGFLGVSLNTVKRRTKALIKAGWMMYTGERKPWTDGWTPVYSINVHKLAEYERLSLSGSNGKSSSSKRAARFEPQGSRSFSGSRFSSGSNAVAGATTNTTDLRSDVGSAPPKSKAETKNLKTENRKPKATPTPALPMVKPPKVCKECGLELKRDENHLLTCPVLNKKPSWYKYEGEFGVEEMVARRLDNWQEL